MKTPEKITKDQTTLTPAQSEYAEATKNKWIDIALHDHSFNEQACRDGIKWLYDFLDKKNPGKFYTDPEVHITDSPWAMHVLANRLRGVKSGEQMTIEPSPWYGTMGCASFCAENSFYQDLGVPLGDSEGDFEKIRALTLSGIYDMVCLKGAVIVSKKHTEIHLVDGRLHRIDGPCMKWGDGYSVYAINGRILPSWIWTEKDTITADQFIHEKNEEIRAGMLMVLGGERMVKLLGAELTDTDFRNDETYRLWKTKETYAEAGDNKLAWVEVTCPSTHTHYFLSVRPDHVTAIAAVVSTWPGMTVEEYMIGQHT